MDYFDIDSEEVLQEETGEKTVHELRMERMRAEKRKQAEKRAMYKKMIPVGIIGLIALAAIISVIIWGIRQITSKKGDGTVDIDIKEIPVQERVVEETIGVGSDAVSQEKPQIIIAGMPELVVPAPTMAEGYKMDSSSATAAVSEEDVQSTYAVLINASTGSILVSKNGNDRMNPASMTKVMTVLIACEHIDDLNKPVEILTEDTDYAYRHDLSNAGFEPGEIVPIKDVLYGAIMPSGGECCHVIERIVAGDEETFIDMMNDKASELGLTATHYTNAAGLYNENHYTTANEMAMVMKAAIENDLCRQILHEHIYTTSSTEQHPEGLELSNWFQRRIEDKYDTTEVLGAKTGFVSQAGNCAASYSVDKNGDVYICVTGQAHSGWRAIFDHVSLYNMYITAKN